MRQIMIASFLFIFLICKTQAQDQTFLINFDSSKDSIHFENDKLANIFLYDPNYQKKLKAFIKAKEDLKTNEPKILVPPQKYFHIVGKVINSRNVKKENIIELTTLDILNKIILPEDEYFMKLQKDNCYLFFKINRLAMPYE